MVNQRDRLFAGLHVGHDDTERAAIERTGNFVLVVAADAHHRRDPRVERRAEDLRRRIAVDRAMLAVDIKRVVARGLGDLGGVHRARQPKADQRAALAGGDQVLEIVAGVGRRVVHRRNFLLLN